MLDIYSQFRNFHVFKKFKYLLGDWWGLDILVVVKRGDYFFYDNIKQLNNPIVKDFLSTPIFKNYFIKSIQMFLNKNSKVENHFVKKPWRQTGLNLFITPLILKGTPLQAVLVATGFDSERKKELIQSLSYLKLSDKSIEEKMKSIKTLSSTDKVYIEKMLQILSEEFFSLLQEKKKQDELIKVLNNHHNQKRYGALIGKSASMYYLFKALEKLKNYESMSLLIEGEKGTGKKLLAKSICEQSSRSKALVQSYNCSSFKGKLLELELFGDEKTCSQKATNKAKKTLIEKLDGGTLILNNIDEISESFQSRLLKYLTDFVVFNESHSVLKRSNVRILALTTKNLKTLSEQGKFNKKLYSVLSTIHLKIPALRQRKTDVPLLVNHFLKKKSPMKNRELSSKAMKSLCQYFWPGNVQELESEIERLLSINSDQDHFKYEDLSLSIKSSLEQWKGVFLGKTQSLKETLRSVEKKILVNCLNQNNWNKAKVARILGTSRTSIVLKSKEYGLIKKQGA